MSVDQVVTPEEAKGWIQEHQSARGDEPSERESAVWLQQHGLLPQRRLEDEAPVPRPVWTEPKEIVPVEPTTQGSLDDSGDEWHERELSLRFELGELDGQRKQLLVRSYRAEPDEAAEIAGLVDENEAKKRHVLTELERIGLLREAVAEEAAAAAAAAVSAARSEAVMDARRLQCRRQGTARLVDETAAAFAAAIRGYTDVCREQRQALVRAGWSDEKVGRADPFDFGIAASFVRALADVGLSGGLFDRCALTPPPHRRPLADVDPRPVEPLAKTERKG